MFTEAITAINISTAQSSSTAINSHALDLDKAISKAQEKLLSLQHEEGFWVFELEADCTIPAEYIMMMHYLGEIDELLQAKIANYLRSRQSKDGSYPLFTGGPGDISCSVKVYYAHRPGDLRTIAVARCALYPGGDHAVPELVSFPPG
jgi:squalene-hopene/tetraprenyl-beta-curcumene cyclase